MILIKFRALALTALALICTFNPEPAIAAHPEVASTGPVTSLWLNVATDPATGRKPHAEMTPFIFSGGWTSAFISSDRGFHCAFKDNPLLLQGDFSIQFKSEISYCSEISSPTRPPASESRYTTPEQWKRNYGSAMGGFLSPDGSVFYTVNHGENKDEVVFTNKTDQCSRDYLLNSINDDTNDDNWSGYILNKEPCDPSGNNEGVWKDDAASYNGFIYLDRLYFDSVNGYGDRKINTMGPRIWPSQGYLAYNNSGLFKSSQGVRHPSVFVENGQVYVFYQDTWPDNKSVEDFLQKNPSQGRCRNTNPALWRLDQPQRSLPPTLSGRRV